MNKPVIAPEEPLSTLVDLTGRRALVTGGGKGIGAAIAYRLAEAGASVTIADVDTAAWETAASLGVDFAQCDITNTTQVAAAVASAAAGAHLDIVVNNAGIFPRTGPLEDATDAFVDTMLTVNVRAQFAVCRESARAMQLGGSIINIASIAALTASVQLSAYAASKGAVISLTRSLAAELGPRGIRVNAIAPGIVATPGLQSHVIDTLPPGTFELDERLRSNPLGHAGYPDAIARVAMFLACDLSSHMTGQTLVADGGSSL